MIKECWEEWDFCVELIFCGYATFGGSDCIFLKSAYWGREIDRKYREIVIGHLIELRSLIEDLRIPIIGYSCFYQIKNKQEWQHP